MKFKGFLIRFSLVAIILLGIVVFINSQQQPAAEAITRPEKTNKQVEITGEVSDKTAAEACLTQLKANLAAANEEDSDAYAKTLIESARTATKKEMDQFFKDYDLSHELLSFEVVKQESDSMLVEARQQTLNVGKKNTVIISPKLTILLLKLARSG